MTKQQQLEIFKLHTTVLINGLIVLVAGFGIFATIVF